MDDSYDTLSIVLVAFVFIILIIVFIAIYYRNTSLLKDIKQEVATQPIVILHQSLTESSTTPLFNGNMYWISNIGNGDSMTINITKNYSRIGDFFSIQNNFVSNTIKLYGTTGVTLNYGSLAVRNTVEPSTTAYYVNTAPNTWERIY